MLQKNLQPRRLPRKIIPQLKKTPKLLTRPLPFPKAPVSSMAAEEGRAAVIDVDRSRYDFIKSEEGSERIAAGLGRI